MQRLADIRLVIAMGLLAGSAAAAQEPAAASLAGVARWQDAAPADLAQAATYDLPGLLRAHYGLAELRSLFGADHVKVAELDGAEGTDARGIVLFDADPQRRAEVFPVDPEGLHAIEAVRVRGTRSRWHCGALRLGMTLAELVRANGAPLRYRGLDWDYGGAVSDWSSGKFAPVEGEPVCNVRLDHPPDARGYPVGEAQFRSDDARYPQQGAVLRVGEIMLVFPDPDAAGD